MASACSITDRAQASSRDDAPWRNPCVLRSCVGGCIGRILLIIFMLVGLALYIKYNGPPGI